MAAKYRKIDPRIWDDEKFRRLAPREKLMAFYCLTGQSNRCGLFTFSTALAIEHLAPEAKSQQETDSYRIAFRKVCDTLKWSYDEGSRVLFIPTWFKYNPPENPKHLWGCLNDLHDLPSNPLFTQFKVNLSYLPTWGAKAMRDYLRDSYGKAIGYQKQEQEQKQEQRKKAARAAPLSVEDVPIPVALDTPEFVAAWGRWKKHRAETKHPLKPTMAESQLATLADMGVAKAIATIDHTVFKGWQGLRAPDEEDLRKNGRKSAPSRVLAAAVVHDSEDR